MVQEQPEPCKQCEDQMRHGEAPFCTSTPNRCGLCMYGVPDEVVTIHEDHIRLRRCKNTNACDARWQKMKRFS